MVDQCIKCEKDIDEFYNLCTECAKDAYSTNIFWLMCDPLITKPVIDRFRENSEAVLTIGDRPEEILFKEGKTVEEEIDTFDPHNEKEYRIVHEKMNSILGEMGVSKDFDENKYIFSKRDVKIFSKLFFKLEEIEHDFSKTKGLSSLYLRIGNLFFYNALKSDIGDFEPEFRKTIVNDLLKEAEGYYRLGLRGEGENNEVKINKNLGKLHLHKKEYEKAEEALKKSLELKSDLESKQLLIEALMNSDKKEEAEDLLETLEKDDSYWILKGDLYAEKGGWGRSVQFYNESKNKKALIKKADLLLENENYEDALDTYSEYLEDVEIDDKGIKGKALCLFELGKTDEAFESIKKSISIDPHDHEKWLLLGDIQKTRGQKEEAKEAYQTAVNLNPENKEVEKKLEDL